MSEISAAIKGQFLKGGLPPCGMPFDKEVRRSLSNDDTSSSQEDQRVALTWSPQPEAKILSFTILTNT